MFSNFLKKQHKALNSFYLNIEKLQRDRGTVLGTPAAARADTVSRPPGFFFLLTQPSAEQHECLFHPSAV